VSAPASLVVAVVGVGGFAACSFVEYAFHRWWFHAPHTPHAPTAQRLHALHHESPRTIIATPFFVSLITCAMTWALCSCVTSTVSAGAFAGGMLLGHAFEGGVHHLLHHRSSTSSSWLRRLKRRHLLHHRKGDENYGVASSVWDRIFRTESAT
jgi:sterol desaturase/sphingolipid hydroxylase (fatty acid hydroxylase superfamily)